MSTVDPRSLALDVLVRVAEGAHSDRALDRALRGARLADRDRRLATELVYGTLRRRQSLDHQIAPYCDRPFDELDPPVRAALRLGAYQCCFLDRVPEHAAVDSAVEAVKLRSPAAAALVNGVLRAWLRRRRGLRRAGDLWQECDVPEWWARRWQQRYGEAAARRWFSRANQPAPLALRPHPRVLEADALGAALKAEGVTLAPSPHCPGGFLVESGSPLDTAAFASGAFSLRGEASQLVTRLLRAAGGDRVLDACAGRGGKAIQCAEDSGGAWVMAAEIRAWRAAACQAEARRARTPEVNAVVADLTRPLPSSATFERVLVDAPCSGLGTVRRRPELKWRVERPDLSRLAARQRKILANAAAALEPGGLLVYATCSTEPEENERVVEAVLRDRGDLRRVPVELESSMDVRLVDADGYFRTYPGFPELEGFFAATLVRRRQS